MIKLRFIFLLNLVFVCSLVHAAGPICEDLFARPLNVAIVGPFSGGKWFASQIKSWGHTPYYIVPSDKMSDYNKQSFRSNEFTDKNGKQLGYFFGKSKPFPLKVWNQNRLMKWVKTNNIDFVIPGSDSGVELAEYINFKLGKLPNQHPFAYKDKYRVNQLLKEAGLPYTKEVLASTYSQVLKAIQNGEVEMPSPQNPLFVKPREGMGTFGAGPVFSLEALKKKFDEVIGEPDPNGSGIIIRELLVSEFLGDPTRADLEFVVDVVSRDGHNVIAIVANYIKRDLVKDKNGNLVEITSREQLFRMLEEGVEVSRVYKYDHYLPYKSKDPKLDHKIQESRKFALQIIQAIGRTNGISHVELMWTEKGPRLIEVNARAAGGSIIEMTQLATGTSEIELYLEAAFAPHRFKARQDHQYKINKNKFPVIIQPAVLTSGMYLDAEKARAFASQFPGFQEFRFFHPHGAPMKTTSNLLNSIGEVLFLFDSPEQAQRVKEAFEIEEKTNGFLSPVPLVN